MPPSGRLFCSCRRRRSSPCQPRLLMTELCCSCCSMWVAEAFSSCSQQTDCFQMRPCWVVQSEVEMRRPAGTGVSMRSTWIQPLQPQYDNGKITCISSSDGPGSSPSSLMLWLRLTGTWGKGPCPRFRSFRCSSAAATYCRRLLQKASGC